MLSWWYFLLRFCCYYGSLFWVASNGSLIFFFFGCLMHELALQEILLYWLCCFFWGIFLSFWFQNAILHEVTVLIFRMLAVFCLSLLIEIIFHPLKCLNLVDRVAEVLVNYSINCINFSAQSREIFNKLVILIIGGYIEW